MDYLSLDDKGLCDLIDNRWKSSDDIWNIIKKVTKKNTNVYDAKPDWIRRLPSNSPQTMSNRIFTNVESVINAVIANPPSPNMIPTRKTEEAKKLATALEKVLKNTYDEQNTKETLRMGLRDLFFSRLLVLKPYWNIKIDNIDLRRVDPTKIRFSKSSRNEEESEFAIEEIETSLMNLLDLFPEKEEEILKASKVIKDRIIIENPDVTYKECWIGDFKIVKFKGVILERVKNPYWDWDGLLATEDEYSDLHDDDGNVVQEKVSELKNKKVSDYSELEEGEEDSYMQSVRRSEVDANEELDEEDQEDMKYDSYKFNFFDIPRKPYIFATVLNNEEKPIGRTSFIEQATPLQQSVDRRKQQIDLNAETINGVTLIDSSVMTRGEAEGLLYEPQSMIWGKGVLQGIKREFGNALPSFIFEDMQDSRNEIDNIMAASSAFRGERQGQETKAGRLALIEQSFLRLNELVQVVDYVNQEVFGWWLQLMKTRYTEKHTVKELGEDGSVEIFEIMQDDIEDGMEVRVIPGKSLPNDRQFMFERAQADMNQGLLSPQDYFEDAGYTNPREKAKNAFLFKQNPAQALGIEEEAAQAEPAGPAPTQAPPPIPQIPQAPPQAPPGLPPGIVG